MPDIEDAPAVTAGTAVTVDPSNADMRLTWDGHTGACWTANADVFDRGIAVHHDVLMRACAIGPGARVLDIGCGTGQTTREAARSAAGGSALGVDLSSRMIGLARRVAGEQGLDNAAFAEADAQIHPFAPASFDVAMSRTGAMFFGDPGAAFANIARALRPGGRLVMCSWQGISANPWFPELATPLAAGGEVILPRDDRPGPFGHADPGRVTRVLEDAGFADVSVAETTGPMWWGADVAEAEALAVALLGWRLADAGEKARADALDRLCATLTARLGEDGVAFPSATWLFEARRG